MHELQEEYLVVVRYDVKSYGDLFRLKLRLQQVDKLLDLLVKDAKEQGVLQIALEATDMGRPLYERYGFVKMEDEMELI